MAEEQVNILIVNDKPEDLHDLVDHIEQMNCKISIASSGVEALGYFQHLNFALVLLNVRKSELDCFETAEMLRNNERTKDIPLIFIISARNIEGKIFKGYEAGCVDYIFKPIDPSILRSKIKVFSDLDKQKKLLKAQSELLESKVKELRELKEVNLQLENLSILDGLTGIPNRRYFDQFMGMSWKNATREEEPLALIMADIDYFKAYNDNYGHIQGDDCLTCVAKTLVTSIKRPADLVARYGGEEFMAVLPNTDSAGAIMVAERMRKNIEQLAFIHKGSQVSDFVTISLGVTELMVQPCASMTDFIKNADNALYQAKQNGRNMVCIAKESSESMVDEVSLKRRYVKDYTAKRKWEFELPNLVSK